MRVIIPNRGGDLNPHSVDGVLSHPMGSWIIAFAALFCSLLLGMAVTYDARLAVIPLIPVAVLMLLYFPMFRLGFITIGGIAALQSSEGINAIKLSYLLGTAFCCVLALTAMKRNAFPAVASLLRPIMYWFYIWLFIIVVSYLVSIRQSIPTVDWIRGAIPYLLFASIPLIVFDVANTSVAARSRGLLQGMFVIAGFLTSLSWAIAWLAKRGYGAFGIDRLFLWSYLLPAALFCFSISAAYYSKRGRTLWLILAFLVFGMFAVTGTRSTLFFLVGPITIILLSGRVGLRKGSSLVLPMTLAVLLVSAIAFFLVNSLNIDLTVAEERFTALTDFETVAAEDLSYDERLTQTELARAAFVQSPIFGVSPGYRFEWRNSANNLSSSYNIDSPLALPANFGLMGVVGVVATFSYLALFLRSTRHYKDQMGVERNALISFVVLTIVSTLMGSPFEDKGFSFAFMFLLAIFSIKLLHLKGVEKASTSIAKDTFS